MLTCDNQNMAASRVILASILLAFVAAAGISDLRLCADSKCESKLIDLTIGYFKEPLNYKEVISFM